MAATPAVTADQFRLDFTEFADQAMYPNSDVNFWLNWAAILLDGGIWGPELLKLGTELFVAHNLTIEFRNRAESDFGGPSGQQVGAVASKSTSAGSVSYNGGLDPSAGHWNQTNFGTRFWQVARMVGTKPLMIGIGCAPPYSGPAWPGPITGIIG